MSLNNTGYQTPGEKANSGSGMGKDAWKINSSDYIKPDSEDAGYRIPSGQFNSGAGDGLSKWMTKDGDYVGSNGTKPGLNSVEYTGTDAEDIVTKTRSIDLPDDSKGGTGVPDVKLPDTGPVDTDGFFSFMETENGMAVASGVAQVAGKVGEVANSAMTQYGNQASEGAFTSLRDDMSQEYRDERKKIYRMSEEDALEMDRVSYSFAQRMGELQNEIKRNRKSVAAADEFMAQKRGSMDLSADLMKLRR